VHNSPLTDKSAIYCVGMGPQNACSR